MYTLCIRYTLDPNRIDGFRTYVENELPVIGEAGGRNVAYYLPTDFAGPTHIGYGLIEIETMAAYERYRQVLAVQKLPMATSATIAASANTTRCMCRVFVQPLYDGSAVGLRKRRLGK